MIWGENASSTHTQQEGERQPWRYEPTVLPTESRGAPDTATASCK